MGSTRGLTAHARTQAPPARPIADPVDAHRYDEAYFLRACEGYEEYVATEGKHLSRRLHQAFEAAEIAPGMTVLDVGCGRGEILRRCLEMNVRTYGVDFAPVAVHMARELALGGAGLYQADAKTLPFPSSMFDRVLMFDLVEHLHPWELDRALQDARRVLGPGGRLIVHTAPNAWYDRFAYPIVRFVRRFDRTLPGQGLRYPKDPRSIIPDNLDVHVNEQSVLSLRRSLTRAGFRARVWLDTPPQHRTEGFVFRLTRHILFRWIPFRWFFEREVFAVAEGAR